MKARLFARYGPERGRDVEFGSEATIGRGRDNTVVLVSPEVSQKHARVRFDAGASAYYLEDLGSLNGTRLDGAAVEGRERLAGLHLLSFGDTAELFFVELDRGPQEPAASEIGDAADRTRVDAEAPTLPPGLRSPAAPRPPGSTTRVEETPATLPPALAGDRSAVAERPAAVSRFVLEVEGPTPGSFPLAEGDNLVGRAHRAAIRLRSRELSRRHATLRVAGDSVWVRDEGSRNHTFVDGREITGETELAVGAELRFGHLVARLGLAQPPAGGGEEE